MAWLLLNQPISRYFSSNDNAFVEWCFYVQIFHLQKLWRDTFGTSRPIMKSNSMVFVLFFIYFLITGRTKKYLMCCVCFFNWIFLNQDFSFFGSKGFIFRCVNAFWVCLDIKMTLLWFLNTCRRFKSLKRFERV